MTRTLRVGPKTKARKVCNRTREKRFIHTSTKQTLTEFAEYLSEHLGIHIWAKVLDVNVCELFRSRLHLSLTLLLRFEVADEP